MAVHILVDVHLKTGGSVYMLYLDAYILAFYLICIWLSSNVMTVSVFFSYGNIFLQVCSDHTVVHMEDLLTP